MFIHTVLFRISKKNIPVYTRDCKIWEKEARKHAGFIRFDQLVRTNEKNQYASSFTWKKKDQHKRFMKKHHDRLVSLSKCPVQVLGYYDFDTKF